MSRFTYTPVTEGKWKGYSVHLSDNTLIGYVWRSAAGWSYNTTYLGTPADGSELSRGDAAEFLDYLRDRRLNTRDHGHTHDLDDNGRCVACGEYVR